MGNLKGAWAGTVLATVMGTLAFEAIVMSPPSVLAQDRQALAKMAEEMTVLIESLSPGSGIILSQKNKSTYYVLTAYHVVKHADWEYTIVTHDKKRFKVDYKTVKRQPGVDIAILEFTSSNTYRTAQIGDSDKSGTGAEVYIGGYPEPGAGLKERFFRFVSGGIVGRPENPFPEGYQLVYDNNTNAGMSGGPVLNARGQLVGVHGQAEVAFNEQDQAPTWQPANQSGTAASGRTNFNFGIPINTFLKMASQWGVAVNRASESSATSGNRPSTPTLEPELPSTPNPTGRGRTPKIQATPTGGGVICTGDSC